LLRLAAAEHRVGIHAGEHVFERVADEEGLEILSRRLCLRRVLGVDRRCTGAAPRRIHHRQQRIPGESVADSVHHCTTMSACREPAVLMVCRMEIMSRGLTPSEFNPATSSSRVTPGSTTASLRSGSSWTWTLVRGTTTVTPVLEKGLGCETC